MKFSDDRRFFQSFLRPGNNNPDQVNHIETKPTNIMNKSILFATSLAFAGFTFSASAEEAKDIVDIAAGNEDFSTLVAAVQAADLVETLKGEGPFTVFAPTNAAFEALPEGTVEALLEEENKEQLVAVLTYHVVAGKVMAADVEAGDVETVQGSSATITVTDDGVKIGDANIVATDIEASNGVIHVIDAVILPPADE